MLFVLISLLATVAFGFALVLVVNYAMIDWENTKVNDLASKIKQNDQNNNILSKGVASHRFTSVDVSDNLKPKLSHKSIGELAGDFYGKTMTVIKTQDYAGWWSQLVTEVSKLRQDWQGTLKKWLDFLFSLAKPAEEILPKDEGQEEKEAKKKAEISNVVEKVRENNLEPKMEQLDTNADASQTFSLVGNSYVKGDEDVPTTPAPTAKSPTTQPEPKPTEDQEATIGLGASFAQDKPKQDMTQFDKLEQKILDKLQESGLKNYDIWIQLGDFYLKYGEREKAKEIFALVLKQAEGEQKEVARNRLISF